MSELISRHGADSENYVARTPKTRPTNVPHVESRPHLDKFLTNAKIVGGAPVEELPDRTPVITDAMRADTLRRLSAPVFVTETIDPDGTVYRSYKENRTVKGDGLRDTLATDRGHGTTDSLKMLREEGAVKTDGLLPSERSRDASGRFAK